MRMRYQVGRGCGRLGGLKNSRLWIQLFQDEEAMSRVSVVFSPPI